jgi:hypothetical protein
MGEPKAFASLSSGLLARKGAARPAMKPQGFGQVGSGLEDLGWNDMGFEPPKPANSGADADHDAFGAEIMPHPVRNPLAGLSPVGSPVHDQQEELKGRLADCSDEGEDYDDTAELYEPQAGDMDPFAQIEEASVEAPLEAVEEEAVVEAPVVAVVPMPAPVPAPAPAPAPAQAPRRAPRARSVPGSKAKAAFTLRLDKDRHLKLRLACAVQGRSAQQLVTDALDALLADIDGLESLADRAPAKRSAN